MAKQFSNGYALLIGVDESAVPRWALPDVAKDVAALEKVLSHPDRCAYPPANVRVVKGKEASRSNILDGLEWLQERIEADAAGNATAIVYYTGHGWRDMADPDQFYLIPYDVREDKIRSRALRAQDFADAVDALKARRLLVVLDCCHAGGMGIKDLSPAPSGYLGSALAPALLREGEAKAVAGPDDEGLEQLQQGQGRAVLSSSTGEERSYMRSDGKMSIFTYYVIEALTGHARPEEGATEVLVSDVMGHVYRHVPDDAKQDSGHEQHPDFQISGNFPIALLLGGKPWSKGDIAPGPLEPISASVEPREAVEINTGGGTFVDGDVHVTQGDFVGGATIVHGDQVGGDRISLGHVHGENVAIAAGQRSRAEATRGLSGTELARLFSPVYQQIESRPEDPNVGKEELADTAEKIAAEAAKGEKANPNKVERWLRFLGEMAPDVLDVTVACLTNPIAGVAAVIRKVAERAREEAQAA